VRVLFFLLNVLSSFFFGTVFLLFFLTLFIPSSLFSCRESRRIDCTSSVLNLLDSFGYDGELFRLWKLSAVVLLRK